MFSLDSVDLKWKKGMRSLLSCAPSTQKQATISVPVHGTTGIDLLFLRFKEEHHRPHASPLAFLCVGPASWLRRKKQTAMESSAFRKKKQALKWEVKVACSPMLSQDYLSPVGIAPGYIFPRLGPFTLIKGVASCNNNLLGGIHKTQDILFVCAEATFGSVSDLRFDPGQAASLLYRGIGLHYCD